MRHEIHNTFGIETYARDYVEYASCGQLHEAIPTLHHSPVLHVGGGSNLLFTKDFDGTVLHCNIKTVDRVADDNDHVWLRAGAGMTWDDFVAYTVRAGLGGAENLSLIPGEVGASAVQNIGAYGVEVKDLIERVECMSIADGTQRVFTNSECGYAYRDSVFKRELKGQYAVTHVTYRLSRHFTPRLEYGNIRSRIEEAGEITPQKVREVIMDIRKSKLPDPKVTGNAGSFFMNPVVSEERFRQLRADYPDIPFYTTGGGVKIPAGWLIERCGWKGRSMGRAGVYSRQALILVNLGGATGSDIVALSEAVIHSVKEKFNIDIHPEVNII